MFEVQFTEGSIDRHKPDKSWGWEEWIVNNDLYCGKRLHFTKDGGCTSLHFHKNKHETMYIEYGSFDVVLIDTRTATMSIVTMLSGSSLVIPPNTPHRIIATRTPAVMVEFSTHHEDDDSYRIQK